MDPQIVIVGAGFGGLTAARALAEFPGSITVVDRHNYHLFQPLLYQVAMAGLTPAEIALPIRSILSKQRNVSILLDEVVSIDLERKTVQLKARGHDPLRYDFLILATGVQTNYFGNEAWSRYALGLKNLPDALAIRNRVLLCFEAAEREQDPERRRDLLRFAVIGGGPTGVELAGALAELARFTLARDFRRVQAGEIEVLLLEAGPRILPSFEESLAAKAQAQLEQLGVRVKVRTAVTQIGETGIQIGAEWHNTAAVIWAAGMRGTEIVGTLGVALDRAGRVLVEDDCSIPGHPQAFAIGDIAAFSIGSGQILPGVSPVAIQQGRSVAANIQCDLRGEARRPFRYRDSGSLATIGRSRAIAQIGRWRFSGFFAWLLWLFVHIWKLIGFQNRLMVFLRWVWAYFTYKRGARLITDNREMAGVREDRQPAQGQPDR